MISGPGVGALGSELWSRALERRAGERLELMEEQQGRLG